MSLDLSRVDRTVRRNCFICNTENVPVSSGIFYRMGSETPIHTNSTNATGQPEEYFNHGNLDGLAFFCPHCGSYVVSGSLMAIAGAPERVRTYLDRHLNYRDAPIVIHSSLVDF